jgi:hypothetical protein
MTTREPAPSLHQSLHRHHLWLRAAAILRHALRAAAAIAVVIAFAVLAGWLAPLGVLGAQARLALTAFAALAILAAATARTRRASVAFDAFLESAERRLPNLRSLLRNAVDLEAAGAGRNSEELAQAVRLEAARALEGARLETLRPRIEPRAPLLAFAGAAAALIALTLISPPAARRSWSTLFRPALAAPPVALAVEPGSVVLSPGAALSVRARVSGTREKPRIERDGAGAGVAIDEATVSGTHVWRFDLPPVTRPDHYRVRVASASSPRYAIELSGEPQPVSFELEYRAPAYARLPIQRGSATRGDLTGLKGTVATIDVTFDRDLDALSAALEGGRAAAFRALTPRRWRGSVPLTNEGQWTLDASAATGRSRFSYAVHVVPDAPPLIVVRTPAGDLDLPEGQGVALEVFGQDDLGLSALDLESRKDPAQPWKRVAVAAFPAQPREAHVMSRWDASPLGLLPGESASFRLALYDNDAFGRGVAYSPTFTLRFPSLTELYQSVSQRQDSTQGSLEKAAEQSKELQKKLDQLARQQAATPNGASFERRSEFQSALERQQELSKKLDQAAGDLQKSLDQANERRAFSEELASRMHELQALVNQIQSPEFREALRRIQQALENLDRAALEQNLPEWRQQNQDMLQNLERSIALLKQLRDEEKLEALARRAEELKRQQDELNREHGQSPAEKSSNPKSSDAKRDADQKPPSDAQARADEKSAESKPGDAQTKAAADSASAAQHGASPDSSRTAGSPRDALAKAQEKAAEESRKLGDDVRQAARESSTPQDQSAMDQAASDLEQDAASAQDQAAQAAERNDSGAAQSHGQQASKSLQSAQQRLAQLQSQHAQSRQQVDLAAMRRGAQDLLSLQRDSEANAQGEQDTHERSDRATDLSDGVSRVADSLAALSKRTPFITPQLQEALGQAIDRLARSGRELENGDRQAGEAHGREGSRALSSAVLELRKSESQMCKSGTQPGGQSASQQMGELGDRQSDVNHRTQEISRRLTEQLRLTTTDQEELHRLAQEQERIRRDLESLQHDEARSSKLLGHLDAAQQEMKEVEETLRQGDLDPSVEQKQQHILSRLLDAARSVNRRDFDPERESRPGEDLARSSPGDIPADLLRQSDRLRMDMLKAEADRYPVQYRAFVEAYLRALNGSAQ